MFSLVFAKRSFASVYDISKIFIKLRKKSVAFEFITLDISIEGIK